VHWHANPRILLARATKFVQAMPNILNTHIAVFPFSVKTHISSLALSRERQIRVRFTDHCRTEGRGSRGEGVRVGSMELASCHLPRA